MSATEELRAMLDERGVEYTTDDESVSMSFTCWSDGVKEWCYSEDREGYTTFREHYRNNLTPEQAVAATLGSDTSAVRLTEWLRGIADEMRNVGASTMTPHELLACYASDVDKVADSLTFAATLGSEREIALERMARSLYMDYYTEWPDRAEKEYAERMKELGVEVDS